MKIGLLKLWCSDAGGYYRHEGPFGLMARDMVDVEVLTFEHWGWQQLILCDVVVFRSPWSKDSLEMLKLCNRMGIPAVVDYDDNLFATPPWNQAQRYTITAHQTIREILACADLVTVSTKALIRGLGIEGKGVVIPSAWDERAFKFAPIHHQRTIISWRGGNSHNEDVNRYLGAMSNVAALNSSLEWYFLGEPPWQVMRSNLKPKQFEWSQFFAYLRGFLQLRPFVHIVPLLPDAFNECKSNISWIEATAAGALVVAPDFEEFQRPGVFNYSLGEDAVEDFQEKLQAAVECPPGEVCGRVQASRDFIRQNLTVPKVNEARYQALKDLVEGRKTAVA